MKKRLNIYCDHHWEALGKPEMVGEEAPARRCLTCRTIWYKYKDPIPPKVVIGYVDGEIEDLLK